MPSDDPGTDELVDRASHGDDAAVRQLLTRHRDRLRRMVAVHMDSRLRNRVDPSDILQETLAEAARKLPHYLQRRPVAFYPWLRQIAHDRLAHAHRRHIDTQKRSVEREVSPQMGLPDESAMVLADQLVDSGTNPSGNLRREEKRRRVRAALAQLPPRDREVLVLRYLEQLQVRDIAEVLQINEGAVNMRQVRALKRLRELMGDDSSEGKP